MGFWETFGGGVATAFVVAIAALAYKAPQQYERIIAFGIRMATVGVIFGVGFVSGIRSLLSRLQSGDQTLEQALNFPWQRDALIVAWPAFAVLALWMWGRALKHIKGSDLPAKNQN